MVLLPRSLAQVEIADRVNGAARKEQAGNDQDQAGEGVEAYPRTGCIRRSGHNAYRQEQVQRAADWQQPGTSRVPGEQQGQERHGQRKHDQQ